MRTIFTLTLALLLISCVHNEEPLDLIKNNVMTEKQESTYVSSIFGNGENTGTEVENIPQEAFAKVQMNIANKALNLHLQVEGIKLCNVHNSGTYYFPTETQTAYWETDSTTTSLSLNPIAATLSPKEEIRLPQSQELLLIPQSTHAWKPTMHPGHSNNSYMLLACRIYNIHNTEIGYQEGKEVMIWGNANGESAEVAIPLKLNLKGGNTHTIDIVLENECAWYDIGSPTPAPILNRIAFNVSVDDWEEW